MTEKILILTILIPFLSALVILMMGRKGGVLKELLVLAVTAFNLYLAIKLFGHNITYSCRWADWGFDFILRLYHFSSFIVLAVAGFGLLVGLYSISFMRKKDLLNHYYAYFLISISFVNGAVLSDNLVLMLFFWEGLLLTLFGMIAIGHKAAWNTAIKALLIAGTTDLCMMLGIGLTVYLSGTFTMSAIHLPLNAIGSVAFILMMIGAISKAGSMPFHSWIPDAAIDAPLPFMALIPAALEKLLGIYLLSRIALDMFDLTAASWVSTMLMIIGVTTILLAVMMALIQKDFKKLLSYHAISQVGYMILGIGTAVPVGIIGGIFHMINHAMYKSCLFLSGGSVEKQANTTDLNRLGGLGRKMPITFLCFTVAALSISGVPPFNGFFSKELVYDGALERGWIFYALALLGSFFTAASFLKLGHAAFLGKEKSENANVKEAPISMLIPMIVIAGFCVLFGLWNSLPLKNLIEPILGEQRLEGHSFGGFHVSTVLVVMTLVTLALALLNHLYGVKKSGKATGASDHIHHAPVLNSIYDKAEKRFFDPYNMALKLADYISKAAMFIDRAIDSFYNKLTVKVTFALTRMIKACHTGNMSAYLAWAIVGFIVIVFYVMRQN